MKIYEYDDFNQRKEVTAEYISLKLEHMDDSEDGIDMYWSKRYRREVNDLKDKLDDLGYVVSLKENDIYINLSVWKYKK